MPDLVALNSAIGILLAAWYVVKYNYASTPGARVIYVRHITEIASRGPRCRTKLGNEIILYCQYNNIVWERVHNSLMAVIDRV